MRRARRERGFSLLEVIVAMAIAAAALGAFYGAAGASATLVLRAQRGAQAAAVATDLIASLGLETPLSPGVKSGTAADGSAWRLEIEPMDRILIDGKYAPSQGLFRVRVTVTPAGQMLARVYSTLRLDESFLR